VPIFVAGENDEEGKCFEVTFSFSLDLDFDFLWLELLTEERDLTW
jgi:hypothetical protein